MKFLPILLAVSLSLVPVAAFAQNDTEDFGKSAVAQSLMKQAAKLEKVPARAIQAPKPAAPYAMQEEIPADVDALMARVESQNSALVREFELLLEKDPLNPDAPKWLAQIAEFHWQTAHYEYLRSRRAWLAALETCADDEGSCPSEPTANYQNAIQDYRRLLAKYPTYEKLDDVLFRLGDALIRNQQAKEGISYLHRLTQTYPDYKELDAAYLAMGEFYFSQKNTGTAQAAYQTIIDKYPQSSFFQYAQYKLAWTYLNLADEDAYRTAVDLFKQVVESIDSRYASAIGADGQIDENKLNVGEVSFRNQALNDLSTTFVELPGGWKEARAYLNAKLPPDKARDKIEQLGAILDAQGKFEEEIELYDGLLAENPTHPHVIDWHTARVEAFRQSNRLEEAEAATRAAIAATLPGTAWYQANENHEKSAIERAKRFNTHQIFTLAIASMTQAEKASEPAERDAAWADAEQLLRTELAHYAQGDSAFDMHYSFAYVLDERSDAALHGLKKEYGKRLKTEPELAADVLVKLKEAAQAYQTIIDWTNDGNDAERHEQIRVAANRQVFVYANILATSDPEWSIINSAKATHFVEEKRGSEVREKEPLTEAEHGFVRSAEQFSTRYPKDDETPAFLWRAAEIYRTHHDYNQAAQRFDAIVTDFPDHQYAAVAVGSMFELYHKANNYEKIEFWAKWLIEKQNFKHYTAAELEDTASFAIDKQAVALADAQNMDAAVATIMRIESSFPHRKEHTTAARFKAAAFEESRESWRAAITLLEPLQEQANTPALCAHAAFKIGVNATKIARYRTSAEAFERAAQGYFTLAQALKTPKVESTNKTKKKAKGKQEVKPVEIPKLPEQDRLEAAQAVFYGAQLFKALGEKSRAQAMLDQYLVQNTAENPQFDLYRVAETIKTELLEEEKATAVPMLTRLAAAIERAALDEEPSAAMDRLTALGADPAFTAATPALQRQILFTKVQYALDARQLEAAQKTMALLTPDETTWGRVELARHAYWMGRMAQIEFENVVLEFPIRTLRKRIEEKAKKRQAAEKHFQQAITYKNAQISTASAYELAQMALHFRDAFKALPPPKELENDPQGLDDYTVWVEDELIFPAEDAAASLLDVARQITIQLESYTSFAQKSAQTLAELKPDAYPVAKASVE